MSQLIPLHYHHRMTTHLKMLPGTKRCELRQHIITGLCYLLRYPFALLNLLRRPFRGRAWQHPRSIVVIKPCCLGDLVMTTPLLEIIRHAYPDASITYVAGTWSKVIPEHHPAVDTVIDCSAVGIPGRYSCDIFHDWAQLPISREQFKRELAAYVAERTFCLAFPVRQRGTGPRAVSPRMTTTSSRPSPPIAHSSRRGVKPDRGPASL